MKLLHSLFIFKIELKLFFVLAFTFILFTIIGTVSHEYGHYFVAKSLDYDAEVSYAYTIWTDEIAEAFMDSVETKYPNKEDFKKDFPEKEKYNSVAKKYGKEDFLITLGGPFQTMLTGTIGLLFLYFKREKFNGSKKNNLMSWLLVFISLFWLRQLSNFLHWLVSYFFTGEFSMGGDEIRAALHLNLPIGTFAIGTAFIAAIILAFIILKIIPKEKRITFITAGLVGGMLGYYIWLVLLGPIVMP